MSVSLPNEILIKIINACVDPYTVRILGETTECDECDEYAKFFVRDEFNGSGHSENFDDFMEGVPQMANLKSVNKMFREEVSLAINLKFDGYLTLHANSMRCTSNRMLKTGLVWLIPFVKVVIMQFPSTGF